MVLCLYVEICMKLYLKFGVDVNSINWYVGWLLIEGTDVLQS